MHVQTFSVAPSASDFAAADEPPPQWAAVYATEDYPTDRLMRAWRAAHPDVPVFGATSFRGVFTPQGFRRGAAVLTANRRSGEDFSVELVSCGPASALTQARAAAAKIAERFGGSPTAVLMHATSGFEERVLEGIAEGFGSPVPVYGGSAGDDQIAGKWKVFANGESVREGFVLAAFGTRARLRGAFLAGYLPAGPKGVVTRASGRVIQTIDGAPAAAVYNSWTNGSIAAEVRQGGNVLLKTNLNPVARVVGQSMGMPLRVLSHPCRVDPDGSLHFFTEFAAGERLELMTGTPEPLVARAHKVVRRALGSRPVPLRGGILVYCAGCLAASLERADDIAAQFGSALDGAPFVGVATFGEQGAIAGGAFTNHHGNLMCTAALFQ